MKQLERFKNITTKQRTHCMVCDSKLAFPVLTLPQFPITEVYIPKKVNQKLGFVDQEFHFCKKCGHGQLSNIIPPELLYGSCYKTRSSSSASASSAIDIFAEFIHDTIGDKQIETVFEVGCNDLYLLRRLKERARILYGVDPIHKGREHEVIDDKIRVIGDFFENVDIAKLGLDIDLVVSSHTLEHIENPKKLVADIMANSSKETLFFFQFPGLESLINDCHFDQVFHQHLNYFSLKSVCRMLDELGADLIAYRVNPYHWGALMVGFKKSRKSGASNAKYFKQAQDISPKYIKEQHRVFEGWMDLTAGQLASMKGETVYGYGAALMLPVLYYYLGDPLLNLKCVIDEDRDKEGLYYLNVPLRVKMLNTIRDLESSTVLVTAINSMKAIRGITEKLIDLNVRRIILPVNLF